MRKLDITAAILVIIGALNWGLVGLFGFDGIDYLFGRTWLDRVIYIAIGFSALYKIINWQTIKQRWK